MSVADLELELARRRDPDRAVPPSGAVRLTVDEALAYRNAGNIPDEQGRSLRLVLHVDAAAGSEELDAKRRLYEPDVHRAPDWRRPNSAKVNVVPLRDGSRRTPPIEAWWQDPQVQPLEDEWRATGGVAGLAIPGEWRGFVFKTIVALRSAGVEVSPDSIADSVARWLAPSDARRLREDLHAANGGSV
ncbi:MAG TPA: hypothetical protein VM573_02200 [Actinomycetota bacterium]|nr:hypothetical protein [Actinomycetota bacterium]